MKKIKKGKKIPIISNQVRNSINQNIDENAEPLIDPYPNLDNPFVRQDYVHLAKNQEQINLLRVNNNKWQSFIFNNSYQLYYMLFGFN